MDQYCRAVAHPPCDHHLEVAVSVHVGHSHAIIQLCGIVQCVRRENRLGHHAEHGVRALGDRAMAESKQDDQWYTKTPHLDNWQMKEQIIIKSDLLGKTMVLHPASVLNNYSTLLL